MPLNVNKSDQASLWQRAEMLRGMTEEVRRVTIRLRTRLEYGEDSVPAADAETARPSRTGLAGLLEDTYDELARIREALLGMIDGVGAHGEGPRGELKTPYPEGTATRAHPPFAEDPRRPDGGRYG